MPKLKTQKRVLSKAQRKALKRNWSKGIITATIKHFDKMTRSKSLTFAEQMKILKCKTLLQELIDEWKPTT